MSDAADRFGFEGRQLLNKSKLNPLRERMQTFVVNHGMDEREFREIRHDAAQGKPLSEIAIDERNERL